MEKTSKVKLKLKLYSLDEETYDIISPMAPKTARAPGGGAHTIILYSIKNTRRYIAEHQ